MGIHLVKNMMKTRTITFDIRKKIEHYLNQSLNAAQISKILDINYQTIHTEIKRCEKNRYSAVEAEKKVHKNKTPDSIYLSKTCIKSIAKAYNLLFNLLYEIKDEETKKEIVDVLKSLENHNLNPAKKKATNSLKKEIVNLYNQGYTIHKIAELLDIHKDSIKPIISKLNQQKKGPTNEELRKKWLNSQRK